jgi:hypothetical protein
MAMVEPEERFPRAADPGERSRLAEERCLDAEQRCFRAERRRFEAERRREQVEELLAQSRRAGFRMAQIVAELRGLVLQLHDAARPPTGLVETGADGRSADGQRSESPASLAPGRSSAGSAPGELSGEQMVDALSAAIVRLRANVEAVGARSERSAQTGAAPAVRAETPAWSGPPPARQTRAPHKHSMSWIARWRNRRKQRNGR